MHLKDQWIPRTKVEGDGKMQKTISLSRYEREGEREGNEEGDEEDVEEEGKIKRVLIFTTNTLMKAFEESDGKASVDRTFFVTLKESSKTTTSRSILSV